MHRHTCTAYEVDQQAVDIQSSPHIAQAQAVAQVAAVSVSVGGLPAGRTGLLELPWAGEQVCLSEAA